MICCNSNPTPITNVFVVKPLPFGRGVVHISCSSIIHAVMYAGSTLYLGLGNYCFVALLFLVVVQKTSLHVNKLQFFLIKTHMVYNLLALIKWGKAIP